jgi:hypothetical protein
LKTLEETAPESFYMMITEMFETCQFHQQTRTIPSTLGSGDSASFSWPSVCMASLVSVLSQFMDQRDAYQKYVHLVRGHPFCLGVSRSSCLLF